MDINFNFFSIDPTTVVGVLCNTLILFLLFKKFLFAPVNKVLEERKNQVSKIYDDADSALENAHEKETEYTEKLSSAKEKSAEILRSASKKAQQRSDEIIGEAKSEAAAIITKANADIEKDRKRAVNSVKDEISDIAVSIAEQIINRNVDTDDEQDRLIDEFISGMDE